MEILKQPQYSPYKVEDQVVVFFAVTNGYFDTVELERVKEFEIGLLKSLRDDSEIMDSIATKKELTKDTQAELERFIDKYRSNFI